MDIETIHGSSLPFVLAKPLGFQPSAGFPLVVLLHGFGASMHDLVGLADAIDASGYVYAFPNGPYSMPLGPGATGYSWGLRQGVVPPPAGSPDIEELLDGFFVEVQGLTGVTPGQVVLGGFSQGGGITLRYGLPRESHFAGLVVLSGAFRDGDTLVERLAPPEQRTTPIFISHGRQDRVLSLELGQATRDFLGANGYDTEYHEYNMAHSISNEVIADLTPWLHRVLPPKS